MGTITVCRVEKVTECHEHRENQQEISDFSHLNCGMQPGEGLDRTGCAQKEGEWAALRGTARTLAAFTNVEHLPDAFPVCMGNGQIIVTLCADAVRKPCSPIPVVFPRLY